jgi:hypothetical protein
MLTFLKSFFRKPAPIVRIEDCDFGWIQFVPGATPNSRGHWQSEGEWTVPGQEQGIGCPDIPGDATGPSDESRAFLLGKRADLETIWRLSEPHIRELLSGWPSLSDLDPRRDFHISSLAKDGDGASGWEVCFETNKGRKWIYFCLQIEGDEVVSNTIDT